ncbi:secreted RxLR effector protein 161-like [Pyrus communis]|uniref:secreted RxLR effector protein 161-like n=1 Tax=Pyrus communis TaxID=23211 RepID=UPI0035C2605F
MGNASFVLRIEITRDRSKGLHGISQKSYIDKVLQWFNMQDCSSGEMSMRKGDRLNKSQCPKNDLEKLSMTSKPYASLFGSIMYAQVCTRPDLAFAISVLSREQSNPGQQHWIAAKKVLRYLQRTKSFMLTYKRVQDLELKGYADSDFAICVDDRKSTSEYIFFIVDEAISWRSAKQNALATSTMEAEFIALFEATKKGIWLKNLISFMRTVDIIQDH